MQKKELIKYFKQYMKDVFPEWLNFPNFETGNSFADDYIGWFELFARSLFGAAPYEKTMNENRNFSGEYSKVFNEILFKKILKSPYTNFHDYDQKVVELVPISIFIISNKNTTWDIYTEEEKESLIQWLNNVNKIKIWKSNWILFRIIINSVICKISSNSKLVHSINLIINKDWTIIDSFYEGNGWYCDGFKENKDYYNAWAFHYYSLIYIYFFSDKNSKRYQIIKNRVCLFSKDYSLWFDQSGESIPYGRSLIYRFANISLFSALAINHIYPIPIAQLKQLIWKTLKMWMNKEIVNDKGLLTLGYYYKNENLCEWYNSSGSPYWAFKAFTALYLKDDDIFWTTEASLFNCNTIIKATANNNHIIMNNGNYCILFPNSTKNRELNGTAKYMRFAYCSKAGINLTDNYHELLSDSSLCFYINNNWETRTKNINYKFKIKRGTMSQKFLWSYKKKIVIFTKLYPQKDGYLIYHHIFSLLNCSAAVTGFTELGTIKDINQTILPFIKFYKIKKGVHKRIKIKKGINTNYSESIMPVVYYKIKKGYSLIANQILINWKAKS